MTSVNREWILNQLKKNRMNQTDLARALGLDRSAVNRLLSGKRGLKAHEQDKIAQILGISVEEFSARRTMNQPGFGESDQATFQHSGVAQDGIRTVAAKEINDEDLPDHPIWGAMAGTITVMPGVDLTAPMEFEWSEKLYNE